MSDNILPFDIQNEIIKRVFDVKSLVRFRAVSKPWKHFIDSSQFIAGYRAGKTHLHSLFLRYKEHFNNNRIRYLSVDDDDTFKVQLDLAPNVTDLMKQNYDLYTIVIGYSRGLLCTYSVHRDGMLILWNPSLRRSVGILGPEYSDVFGFVVCPITNEPTIIKILNSPWKVEIFTFSSKIWTVIECSKPRESITLHGWSHVVIDSYIYRVAYETIRLPDGKLVDRYMIVSFDLDAKEFKAIDLPDKITDPFTDPVRFELTKLNGSLVVVVPHREVKVWKMECDCSFTKLFTIKTPTINTPHSYEWVNNIVGFRKNGELLVETQEYSGQYVGVYGEIKEYALKSYDPCSQHMKNIGFSGLCNALQSGYFFVSSYKETLHLLDHSDSCVYPEIN